MHSFFKSLTNKEKAVFKKLNTPKKIQDFLEIIPINFEENGDTIFSPTTVIKRRKAHCLEGALLAAAILYYHKNAPIIIDLQPGDFKDDGHAIAVFKQKGKWGAISKTNHATLRFRDPVYKNHRELVMSYFHEYFLDDGVKTLRSYTVFDLRKIKKNWIANTDNLWCIDEALNKQKYIKIISKKEVKSLRKADKIEIESGKIIQWKKKSHPEV